MPSHWRRSRFKNVEFAFIVFIFVWNLQNKRISVFKILSNAVLASLFYCFHCHFFDPLCFPFRGIKITGKLIPTAKERKRQKQNDENDNLNVFEFIYWNSRCYHFVFLSLHLSVGISILFILMHLKYWHDLLIHIGSCQWFSTNLRVLSPIRLLFPFV